MQFATQKIQQVKVARYQFARWQQNLQGTPKSHKKTQINSFKLSPTHSPSCNNVPGKKKTQIHGVGGGGTNKQKLTLLAGKAQFYNSHIFPAIKRTEHNNVRLGDTN